MEPKLSRTSRFFLCMGLFLPWAAVAQPDDGTNRLLLPAAAPNRAVGPADRPNVLFIVVDDLNVALGSYLDSSPHPQYATAKTPNLDRLAAEGIRFERAYVQNPLCNPSRASFLSGLRPSSTDIYDGGTYPRTRIGDELRMLPEHFHDHGYFTARVGKIGHNLFEHAISWDVSKFALSREPALRFHVPGYLPGIDLSEVRDNTWTKGSEDGMSRAEVLAAVGRPAGLPLSWRATTESPRMTPDGTTATRIIQLLAENRDRPFFIAAGFHKPHQPWVGPATFFAQHAVDEIQLPKTPPGDTEDIPDPAFQIAEDDASHTERQKRQAIAAYHAMVTMTDSYVGQLLDALELLELDDSTIVVFTSDHGFQLNEHGGLWRKTFQFEESTRVPLIVRLPDGRNAGQVAAGLVELVDLYPTLIDLARLPSPAHALEGTSFVPLSRIRGGSGSRRRSRNRSVRAFTAAPCARSATGTRSGRRCQGPMVRRCRSSTTSRKTPSNTTILRQTRHMTLLSWNCPAASRPGGERLCRDCGDLGTDHPRAHIRLGDVEGRRRGIASPW